MSSITYQKSAFFFFVASMLIYAVMGSATPDNPGLTELCVAVFLLLSSVYGFFAIAGDIRRSNLSAVKISAIILLVYGLTFSLPFALINGNDSGKIMRDVLAFLLLLMPLFFIDLVSLSEKHKKYFIAVVVLSGLVFSLRGIFLEKGMSVDLINFDFDIASIASQELLYLSNSPFVLFAAIMLVGCAFHVLAVWGYGLRSCLIAIGLIMLSLFPIMSMASVLQRAGVGYFLLSILLLGLYFVYKSPARILPVFCVFVALIAIAIAPIAMDLFEVLSAKTASVGANNRIAEANAVLNEISNQGYIRSLFGLGWGGEFHSPAVGEVKVNFTHSLLTSMLLKTGIIGMILCGIYLLCIADNMLKQLRQNPVLFFALSGPILIGCFLYANYKSIDYGVILLLASIGFAKQKPSP